MQEASKITVGLFVDLFKILSVALAVHLIHTRTVFAQEPEHMAHSVNIVDMGEDDLILIFIDQIIERRCLPLSSNFPSREDDPFNQF